MWKSICDLASISCDQIDVEIIGIKIQFKKSGYNLLFKAFLMCVKNRTQVTLI